MYLVFVVEFYGVFGVSNKQVKKNQHYVSQSYLRRFTIDGEKSLIWSFDKKANKFLKNTSSINKICCEDYYYYQLDEGGNVDHTKLEDAISEIEKIGNDILNEIIGMSSMPIVSIPPEKRGHLSFYIAFMLTRGPSYRDAIHEVHGFAAKSMLRQLYSQGALNDVPELIQASIKEKGLEAVIQTSVHKFVSLEPMIRSAQQISLSFLKKGWVLLNAQDGSEFITSDTPVIFYSVISNCDSIGPGHINAEAIFPISKKLCLVITPTLKGELEIAVEACTTGRVSELNKLILGAANDFAFCSKQYDWLLTLDAKSIAQGQKIVSGIERKGFNVIENPFKK
ncbi:DUF4238 domain-containing protein [Yersinia enterocolitica]|nr:DUF4238 domain-containing protein [Yersinia enterocolitica]EKN5990550.1 DUF4238 domain-containing protein [Yersinia enterocolitica]